MVLRLDMDMEMGMVGGWWANAHTRIVASFNLNA